MFTDQQKIALHWRHTRVILPEDSRASDGITSVHLGRVTATLTIRADLLWEAFYVTQNLCLVRGQRYCVINSWLLCLCASGLRASRSCCNGWQNKAIILVPVRPFVSTSSACRLISHASPREDAESIVLRVFPRLPQPFVQGGRACFTSFVLTQHLWEKSELLDNNNFEMDRKDKSDGFVREKRLCQTMYTWGLS